ncbi:putative transporter [Cercospora beticola]|uniref:Putative transporter n=1 Tax=Cercospora beticola TaxID=122368 RepID=A0A2G5I4R0_CERBT|nr:putative transporter [Cercospora beticola]PIA99794.1 putative transporter [Cercospora beticola]WPB00786.1 hypothetical protein RHO25_005406 [Cercospora beticola]CAK1360977.1 unnamed protein product [Cercospora beticola]
MTTRPNGGESPTRLDDKIVADDNSTDLKLESVNSANKVSEVKSSEGYYNFEPIAALNLPDWRVTERALVRKLDFTLLPTLWVLYLNNYLDRTNIAQARLNTIEEDLNMGPEDYNIAVSVLTVGYMLAQLPSNMLLTRVRPGIYLPATVMIWSAVSASTAAASSPETLFVIRFFLGITEAPLFPGAVYLMTCWYTRKELALRTAILYSGLVLAQALSGVLAAGIFQMDGVSGLAGWQWLFILEALMSVVCGVAAFWTLPDYPHSKTGSQTWSMNEDMRRLAEARMEADRVTGASGTAGIWHGVKLCLVDPKLYLFTLLNLTMTASYGFNFFFPTLLRGFNIGSNTVSLLLTAPPYVTGAIVSFVLAWNSDRIKERGWHISGGLLAAAIGFIITVATDGSATIPRYVASFLYAPGSFAANALVYSWAVSTLSATPEKRAAGGAIVNIIGHVGNIISPYFFRDEERPTYRLAFILMLVFGGLAFGFAFSTKMFLKRTNKKLREVASATGTVYSPYTT